MFRHISILIAIYSLLLGCNIGGPAISKAPNSTADRVEDGDDQTFLGSCKQLQVSEGFRQNIWLNFNKDGHGAICMDLNRNLYFVVDTELPIESTHLSKRFRDLRISATTLRERMDSEAFILAGPGIDLIFRIPPDAEESFAADLFNDLLGLNLRPTDIRFHWD
jgi:hypothetical protein